MSRAASLSFLFPLLASCGAPTAAAPSSTTPVVAGASAGATATATSKPAAPLGDADASLPAARTVAPSALGSKVGSVRGRDATRLGDPAPAACVQGVAPMAPAPRAAALAKACAPGAAAGAPAASLALGDSAAAAAVPFAAEAGACYRFAVAAEPKVEGFVLVVMDANGGVALEAKTDDGLLFAPADGPLCFSSSSASRVLVSARRGAGTGALQVVRVRD